MNAKGEKQVGSGQKKDTVPEEDVDGGRLRTMGIYPGRDDFDWGVVRSLLKARLLAPFWFGFGEDTKGWTNNQICDAIREQTSLAIVPFPSKSGRSANAPVVPLPQCRLDRSRPLKRPFFLRRWFKRLVSVFKQEKPPQGRILPMSRVSISPLETLIALRLYKETVECDICFYNYPPFLNQTSCCGKAICTECFVQLKRSEPHHIAPEQGRSGGPREVEPDNLVSDPAACPYCLAGEFGVTYDPPPFRHGLPYEASPVPLQNKVSSSASGKRAKAIVTPDIVHPDWEAKLEKAKEDARRRLAEGEALEGDQGDQFRLLHLQNERAHSESHRSMNQPLTEDEMYSLTEERMVEIATQQSLLDEHKRNEKSLTEKLERVELVQRNAEGSLTIGNQLSHRHSFLSGTLTSAC
ncbi:hypothetical protein K470DRAFT_257322 [Piedraia hortae CBS 480.64]|uniref:RING-type domain-containing protein n=1 Tax=Piedraia hortae CBS 480.64 TaxID=1314780 RepID=A0A6A7C1T6_9PEZI|nr:hypothetical protein K470DRAFT_257322 [Piedraia hortae CBS 480.64]